MPYIYDHPHPAVTVDIVLIRSAGESMSLLLIRRAGEPFAGHWALPGGFVDIDEDLEDAACRELAEETGLTGIALTQLHTFGRPDRDPRERVISVVYYALLGADEAQTPEPGSDAREARWFPLGEIPPMAFDHAEIIGLARQRLMTLRTLGARP